MIGSFWNLCRACPSMPVDKLHSEYRSTYRWHEYTGGPEVIRRPPVPNQFASSTDHFFSKSTEDEKPAKEGPANEPPLPRRKKCPELAYRHTEFISCDEPDRNSANTNNNNNRARFQEDITQSEERGGTPSRRSKSEGPPGVVRQGQAPPPLPPTTAIVANGIDHGQCNGGVDYGKKSSGQAGESSGLFKKTISKLSTEYRLQFVWPNVRRAIRVGGGGGGGGGGGDDVIEPPRKSLSMGAIKSAHPHNIPMVHKKRTTNEKEAAVHELEPLFKDCDDRPHERKHYEKHTSDKEKFGFEAGSNQQDNKLIPNGHAGGGGGTRNETWYKEVIELRKKAGEYKCRGWGIEIDPDLHKKQKELWDQVSRRSSLSALSLASTVRPITKEEKEKENNKKSSPTKGQSRFPGHALPIGTESRRKNIVRHHLERTTGPDVEEGAILPSPTREKLMPTIPKSKDDESYNSQRGSPKKSATSRHGSPQKGSPQKGSPKKMTKVGRSQSVGPGVQQAHQQSESSPKRQIRSGSTSANVPPTSGTPIPVSSTKAAHKKTPVSTPTSERRPRPTTLSTTARTRTKSSSLPPSARAHSAPNNNLQNASDNKSLYVPNLRKNKSPNQKPQTRPKSTIISGSMTDSTIKFDELREKDNKDKAKATAETDEEFPDKDSGITGGGGGTSISSASPMPPQERTEHIIKSPPEPTRVKSPEQILMRSPDPVNWTVPLDTGKTFTVTQNVRDGDVASRPHSEFKASTPVDKPPPAPQSAPPEFAEQAKMEAWKKNEHLEQQSANPISGSSSIKPNIVPPPQASSQTLQPQTQPSAPTTAPQSHPLPPPPEVRFDKPVPGSTLRCLDDPIFDPEINSPSASRGTTTTTAAAATDVLEKARNRFDRFWGGSNAENEKEENV